MLTEAQYVEQQRSLGRRIHEHDGAWWETVYPGYCKPAFIYKVLPRGVRPAWRHRWFGYGHLVAQPEQGNRTLPMMSLDRARLEGFGLPKLPSKKRNNVRRALEKCAVAPLTDIEKHLERIRLINVSQALRHEENVGAQIPARRYMEEADSWRAQIRSSFALAGREWWGAFVEGELAAYLRTYQVDGVRVIQHAKVDADYYKFYPMDALYFTVLAAAAADSDCRLILNGRPMHPSLNHFKEQFLFAAVAFPYYSTHAGLMELGKRLRARWRGGQTGHGAGPRNEEPHNGSGA
ncbi:MAG: hypothetical protein EOL90_06550 [Spartobacteria bacterium]|nr:hypothetical protein [Spartobacteria bacterium]